MYVWDKGPRTIVSLLLSSTAHKFWFSEIVERTGLARGTVSSNLQQLQRADVVRREKERFNFDQPFRAARVYYTVNPLLIGYLRLSAPST
jgi:DNA-binding transcriptional regulator GbsR (MarR family)